MLIHELYGIQAEALETERREYAKLLVVLRTIKNGNLDIARIEVGDTSWSVKPEVKDE